MNNWGFLFDYIFLKKGKKEKERLTIGKPKGRGESSEKEEKNRRWRVTIMHLDLKVLGGNA